MRTWLVVLLAFSCIDFTIVIKRGDETPFRFNLSWITRIVALILFLTNY